MEPSRGGSSSGKDIDIVRLAPVVDADEPLIEVRRLLSPLEALDRLVGGHLELNKPQCGSWQLGQRGHQARPLLGPAVGALEDRSQPAFDEHSGKGVCRVVRQHAIASVAIGAGEEQGEQGVDLHVITKLEPDLFLTVTGLTVEDFHLLVRLKVFNTEQMNQAVFAFRRYEDSSLAYTGIDSHPGLTHYGLYDTVVAREA